MMSPIVISPKKHSDELKICIDFTHLNRFIQHEYLISNSPFEAVTCIHDLRKDATAPLLIKELKMFSRFRTPVQVISDRESQFKYKVFKTFANEWGFMHTLSSPTRAQSNDKAEAVVKNIKKLLKVWLIES